MFFSGPEKRTQIIDYFEAIGERYDLADAMMSFGLHFLWRRTCIKHLRLKPGFRLLDLCGGTGEFARRIADAKGVKGLLVVCDFSMAMMSAGKVKADGGRPNSIQWVKGDAEALSFGDQTFDAVMIGFGIRNLVDLKQGIAEIARVLKPGGRLIVLEFSIPENRLLKRLYHVYADFVMPGLGKIITGRSAPFRYLAASVRHFPPAETIRSRIAAAGFPETTFSPATGGLVTIYKGIRKG